MKNIKKYEETTIFDIDGSKEIEKSLKRHTITFVKTQYQRDMTYEEMFEGFDELYVITYSHSLQLIEDLIPKFEKVEIILGNPNLVKGNTLALIAYQDQQMKELRKVLKLCNKKLADCIEEGKLKFYLPINFISHEKIYLLKAKDGRTRIVEGSPNFSMQALNSGQRENITAEDNNNERFDNLYDYWLSSKNDCTTSVSPQAIFTDDPLKENIPIIEKVVKQNIPLILTEEKMEHEICVDISHALTKEEINEFKKEHKELFANHQKDKYLIRPEEVKIYHKRIKKEFEKKERMLEVYPNFVIDYQTNTVSYNHQSWNLNPKRGEVITDIKAILNYFKGFDAVEGNSFKAQSAYFKVLNYLFLSPFLAKLRNTLYLIDKDAVGNFFPMFLVLWGTRSTGKSHFVEMCQQCMFDKSIPRQNPETFTKTGINTLLGTFKGVPILIDEVKRTNFFNNIQQICKGNDVFLEKQDDHLSCIIVTSNEIGKGTINQDISKRVIIIRFDKAFTFENTYHNSKQLMGEIRKMHNAFYREYLRRMFPKVSQMVNDIVHDINSQTYPDIFHISSKTILEILKNYDIEIPNYFLELCHQDYMGDKAVSVSVLEDVEFRWRLDPTKFNCKRNKNILEFETDSIYEAKKFAEELPKDMQVTSVGNTVYIQNLKVAEKKYFGFSFKKRFLPFR